ncbi:MAG TPA: SDR family NAD(P)-dependent oxidoreductase [Solirubrobacteraceae bacterium]|nr:SDR family NAD(P)-dependent oxidoreductase [Solirubrobacteraceae bacterium]
MRISGSGALVAGGASGLGEATALRLHAEGAHVVIADLDQERGEQLAAELGERAAFAERESGQHEQSHQRQHAPARDARQQRADHQQAAEDADRGLE